MSDEKIQNFMDSVQIDSDEDDFSDDELEDPDYIPEEISPEDDQFIMECIVEMNSAKTSDVPIQDINLSGLSNRASTSSEATSTIATVKAPIEPFSRVDPSNRRSKASRYDRKKKEYVEIDCPQILREYNSRMGGVDLMDGLMGRYYIRLKTRNPMIRLFYHLADMAATNAYILYRRTEAENSSDNSNYTEEKLLKLSKFREEKAAGLVSYKGKRSVGRPSTREKEPSTSSGIGQRAKHPVPGIRYDNIDHFPLWLGKDGGKKNANFAKHRKHNAFVRNAV